ncbi:MULTISPECIES: chemotaxis protein CheW [Falsihalocynthiibacter]|jgi:purine-binding chemotaxis protein CheW|uniref:Chemotaxis protein CheW n=1 Tax=Falsihalocynthiibacter arcticus TaxID=1579316 RepID=A0A126V4N9_9RHOB|nr:chemotaxis protein CheW [Falsihalocynthiibacter arcticus]AML52935.1 chemotaxis protein CheW [Falsihalocynthiibacter arcticus]
MTNTATEKTISELELLSFRVGEQEYAVDIMSVREIRGWTRATPLPHSPHFVRGVINLRGTVLPIIDLAARLGQNMTETSARNVFIVVQSEDEVVGLLVDAVSDILTVTTDELQAPPDMAADANQNFVSALTIVDDRMLRVLDLRAALLSAPLEVV